MKAKTALITGASSGIGKELARIHAERGGNLIIVARRKDKLIELKKEIEQKYDVSVIVISKDLSDEHAAKDIYEEVKKKGLVVDYLINNAGFGGIGKFHERDWDKDYMMIKVNIIALTALTRLFLNDFVKRNAGRILNVSSTASLPPGGPLQAVYFATKAYVTSFSYGVAEELANTNVTITALLPGATNTEFAKTAHAEKTSMFQHAFSARRVAEDGYVAMLKGTLSVVSGLTFMQKIMIAAIPFVPKRMLLKQMKRMQEVKT